MTFSNYLLISEIYCIILRKFIHFFQRRFTQDDECVGVWVWAVLE